MLFLTVRDCFPRYMLILYYLGMLLFTFIIYLAHFPTLRRPILWWGLKKNSREFKEFDHAATLFGKIVVVRKFNHNVVAVSCV